MSVPIAMAGLKLKRKIRSGVMSEPPPIPVIPTRSPVMRPAMMRRGSFKAPRLVDGQDVARRAPHDVLRDAPLDEPLEEAFLAHPDHDQVSVPLLGERDDRLRRPSRGRDELSPEPTLGQVRACLVKPLLAVLRLALRGLAVGGDDIGDDQR